MNSIIGYTDERAMDKETTRSFIRGLKAIIKRSGMTQESFAEGVTSSVNLSNILREVTGTSTRMQEALARKAGKEVAEIVLIGKQEEIGLVEAAKRDGDSSSQLVNSQEKRVAEEAILSIEKASVAVRQLVDQHSKTESDMRLWRLIFEMLPVPAIIIKDGNIWYQNQQSRAWGHESGKPLSESCLAVDCEKTGDCPVRRSVEHDIPATGRQCIGGNRYNIETTTLTVGTNNNKYVVVVATRETSDLLKRRSADKAIS